MASDGITIRKIMASFADAVEVENYPHYPKGPCVLVLQKDSLEIRFTSCGGFRRVNHPLRLWSPLIDQNRNDGHKIFEGEDHEKETEN